jgi:hypothetical protein
MPRRLPCCRNYLDAKPSRRAVLKAGALGLAGLGLPDLLRAEESARPRRGKATARSVILLFQFGGPSHIDTFDPKPDAPTEVRGEFGVIPTSVPGVRVSEHLPRLARIADRYALLRGVHHTRSSHNPGAYYSLTGREPLSDLVTSNASAVDFPHPGSVVAYLDDDRGRKTPPSVSLPTMIADGPYRTPGEFAGFLGKMYDPLWVLSDPNASGFNVQELTLPAEVNLERLDDRKAILDNLDAQSRLADKAAVMGMKAYRARALDLLSSPATKKSFALDKESDRVRDRYGRHTYGQSVLLARRLIEAGVRFVTVYYSAGIGGWDTHKDNFNTLKNSRLPQTDQAVSALLEDLEARGLLSETLVYWTGDFGRSPKVNRDAGRDHWPQCQTVLMAGGGVRGGQAYGASDRVGAYPLDKPARPDDVTATVFHALGFDQDTFIHDQLGRPGPISAGEPLRALFG